MPSLVATTSALARTTCVRTHFVRTKISFPILFTLPEVRVLETDKLPLKFQFTLVLLMGGGEGHHSVQNPHRQIQAWVSLNNEDMCTLQECWGQQP